MYVHDVCKKSESKRVRKRVGRGIGTGSGKTSGRGHKGAGSRSGNRKRLAFEGGQSPVFRRVAKKGQSTRNRAIQSQVLRLSDLLKYFSHGDYVDSNALFNNSLITNKESSYKILSFAPIEIPLNLCVRAISRAAIRQILAAGGSVVLA